MYESIDRLVTADTGGSVKSVEGSGLVPVSATALPVDVVVFTLDDEPDADTDEEADEVALVLECVNVWVNVTVVPKSFVVVTVDKYSPEDNDEVAVGTVVVVLPVDEVEVLVVGSIVALLTVWVRVTVVPTSLVVVNTVVKKPVWAIVVAAAAAVAGSHIVVSVTRAPATFVTTVTWVVTAAMTAADHNDKENSSVANECNSVRRIIFFLIVLQKLKRSLL